MQASSDTQLHNTPWRTTESQISRILLFSDSGTCDTLLNNTATHLSRALLARIPGHQPLPVDSSWHSPVSGTQISIRCLADQCSLPEIAPPSANCQNGSASAIETSPAILPVSRMRASRGKNTPPSSNDSRDRRGTCEWLATQTRQRSRYRVTKHRQATDWQRQAKTKCAGQGRATIDGDGLEFPQ